MNNKKENLDELLKQFFIEAEAKKVSEDMVKGEEILRKNLAPGPDEETIIVLKAKVAKAIAAKRQKTLLRSYYRTAAFAAAVLLIALLSIHLLEHKPAVLGPMAVPITRADADLFYEDTDLETLIAEVEQVHNEIVFSEWNIASEGLSVDLINLEIELIDIDSDFWKG